MRHTMFRRSTRLAAGLASAVLVLSAVVGGTVAASAQTGSVDAPLRTDFYGDTDLAGTTAPGDVVRSEPMTVAGTVPGLDVPWGAAEARRLLYRSTGAEGVPTTVSGVYMRSTVPWSGPGPRPLAVVAPGTQGQGDQCAPSSTVDTLVSVRTSPPSVGVGYDMASAWTLLSRGVDVVITDYEGLGTPGIHTYVDHHAEARAVLDAARAALRLPGTELRPESAVVATGYSQGGGAVAAAAEAQPEYAPELRLTGVAAAAPPADLLATLDRIDGSLISGVVGYALNGFTTTRPELRALLDARLNPAGREILQRVAHECIPETILSFGLRESRELTLDGRSLSENVREIPEVLALLDEQRIGYRKPGAPVKVYGNLNDDAVPYGQVAQLARDWCARGATVELATDTTPPLLPRSALNHLAPMLLHLDENANYLTDRARGVPAPSSCSALP